MADNVTIKDASGSSVIIRADDVSSVYHQFMKLNVGGDGLDVPVSTTENLLPVGTQIIQSSHTRVGPKSANDIWVVTVPPGAGFLNYYGYMSVPTGGNVNSVGFYISYDNQATWLNGQSMQFNNTTNGELWSNDTGGSAMPYRFQGDCLGATHVRFVVGSTVPSSSTYSETLTFSYSVHQAVVHAGGGGMLVKPPTLGGPASYNEGIGTFSIGAEMRGTEPPVSNYDNAWSAGLTLDSVRKLIVTPWCIPLNFLKGLVTISNDATDHDLFAAAASGIRNYLSTLYIINKGSTDVYVDIKDGSSVIWTVIVKATSDKSIPFDIPLRGSTATALKCACEVAIATGDVIVMGSGFKSGSV